MRAHFVLRIASMVFCFSAVAVCADWNPKLAAEYLDSRQKEWAVWPRAAQANGQCFSCHTGMTYMLARPALRGLLNEKQPTEYETAILERMRAKAGAEPPGTLQGVETIFTALFLARNDPKSDAAIRKAFDQLWALQIGDGRLKGAWRWYSVNLDPWETPPAFAYGASLAALALGSMPADYRNSPEIQAHIENLKTYLHTDLANQPLHSRLAMLWASTAVPDLFTPSEQKAIIDDVLKKQHADGGWSLESLGPWAVHPDAAPSPGNNSYATAFAAYVLLKAGVAPSDPALRRTWDWLKANQDPKTGAWPAASMNKRYPAGSMEESFLQDAATAFASMALVEAGESNAQVAFDAASVKRNNSGAQQALIQLQPGGRFVARNVPLRMVITRAYGKEEFQILGAPAWMSSARFDITARAAASPAPDQLSSMLRGLLAERFRLASHIETRDLARYVLVVAKKDGRLGPALRRSNVDCDAIAAAAAGGPPKVRPGESPPCSIVVSGPSLGRWAARDKPWPDIAASLSKLMGRTVVDGTGLKGSFSADLTWSPEQALQDSDSNAPSIFTAIDEQLGLKVESRKGPVELLVIDRIEPPTEN